MTPAINYLMDNNKETDLGLKQVFYCKPYILLHSLRIGEWKTPRPCEKD